MDNALKPFDAAKLKLKRADQHVQELAFSVAAYMATKPFAVIVEQPAEWKLIGSHVWVTRIRQPVPLKFATVIGDAIHNMRSALDILASDLVRLNGQSPDSVHFPFSKSAADLDGQIKQKNFIRAHPDCINLLRTMKPYTGGNVALRGLHDLDIRDKHYALVPSISAAKTTPFIMKYGKGITQIPSWHSTIPKDGWWMVVMPPMANVPLGSEIRSEFSLVFDDDTAFAGGEIVPTLRSLSENVAGVVKAFETLCEGQAFPVIAPTKYRDSVKALIIGPTSDPDLLNRATRIDHVPNPNT